MRAILGACTNIAATADVIITAKKKIDANVATTANVMASDTRAGTNIAVNANANKTAINTRKRVPMDRRPQMPT